MPLNTYISFAVVCLIGMIFYWMFTWHEEDRKLTFLQKTIYSIIAALVLPLIIHGAIIFLGLGFVGHGG